LNFKEDLNYLLEEKYKSQVVVFNSDKASLRKTGSPQRRDQTLLYGKKNGMGNVVRFV
jgi:hypothetical protein